MSQLFDRRVSARALVFSKTLCLLALVGSIAMSARHAVASTYEIYGEADTYFNLPPYDFFEGGFQQSSGLTQSNSVN